ncbi:MAG: TIGR00730 family Rossman fold protein [Candidatus Omnitrophica bacterium CG11_big_fil_rev_8_21_14_0_20_45_26]|uniref:AMP nucleosidase n=1 Tax=Candidatus Abzuiibacterium crystallinum TaxID=1974748 RepID=A0A2H0LQX2_9BACT|nr:MAG: TIGR00730 family Rossman fold protein [Candidatus Omnitrophica bacterium CG11_big_fil_rev_8_21_14_0_20_45_26]
MKRREKKSYRVGIQSIDQTIQGLVQQVAESRNSDLINDLFTTIVKIAREKASRGDLKVLNTAVKELRHTFRVFEPYRHVRKVAIFGSARTPASAATYKSARQFGKLMAAAGWMVITGGSTGIMRAGHEGAGGFRSFGLNIRLPFEQEVNPVIRDNQKLIHYKYFFTRKLAFIKESHATVLYPGGFGTHDEGVESLTLVQTGKDIPRPIVLVDTQHGRYWEAWLEYVSRYLLRNKMISPDDLSLPTLVKSPEEAREVVLKFYGVYHSLRYVGQETVIRTNREISSQKLKQLNKDFRHLLINGRIELSGALPAEADESEIQDLPRLKMRFNRRTYGSLKRFIDALNQT